MMVFWKAFSADKWVADDHAESLRSVSLRSDSLPGAEETHEVESFGCRCIEKPANDHKAQNQRGLVEETAISVGTTIFCSEWSSTRSCSSAAYCAVWHDDLTEGNEKRRKTAACARLPHGQQTPIFQEGNQRGKSTAGKGQSPSCAFQQRGRC